MPKLRPAKPDEVKRILEKSGFTCIRQSGSHMIFHHSDGSGRRYRYIKARISVDEFERLR